VVSESEKEDTLNIAESPFGHRVEADVEDHILFAKKLFDSLVEEDEYMGRDPIIRVTKKLFGIRHPIQLLTQPLEQWLYQQRIALLNIVNDGFGVNAVVVSFHGL
jgi:hypothetical protein